MFANYLPLRQLFTPPVRNAYALVLTPLPIYARTQLDFMYTKHNKHNKTLGDRSLKQSFYANMFIFNYNRKFIIGKYIWWIFKKKRTYAAAWLPPPPSSSLTARPPTWTQCVRIGRDSSLLTPLCTYVLYESPLTD